MRLGWLPLAAALVVPAAAEPKTDVIPLHFASAAEVQQMLTQVGAPGGGGLAGRKGPALPKGILALSVDLTRNALAVTGEEEGLRELRSLVRLIDVPSRQIRVTVHRVPATPELERQLAATVVAVEPPSGAFRQRDVEEPERKRLLEGAGQIASLPVSNNRLMHLRVEDELLTFHPRLNGDGSHTLLVRLSAGENPTALRRTPSGGSLLLRTPAGTLLLVRVETVREAADNGADASGRQPSRR